MRIFDAGVRAVVALVSGTLAPLLLDCGGTYTADQSQPGTPDASDDVNADGAQDGSQDAPIDASEDGAVDAAIDALTCQAGTVQSCYPGPATTADIGACKSGIKVCSSDGSGYGACLGAVLPVDESCASPLDDDCDGLVNEDGSDCVCTQGETTPCYTGPGTTLGVGACAAGTQTCVPSGAGYGPCTGQVLPTVEDCSTSKDEDCDTEPDCPGDPIWVVHTQGNKIESSSRGLGKTVALTVHLPNSSENGVHRWIEVDALGNFTHLLDFADFFSAATVAGRPDGITRLVVGVYDKLPPIFAQSALNWGSSDLFAVQYSSTQSPDWKKPYPASNGFVVSAIPPRAAYVEDKLGSGWYIAGEASGVIPMGATGLQCGPDHEPAAVRLDTKGGTLFAKRLLSSGGASATLTGSQTVSSGLAVGGTFQAPISIGNLSAAPTAGRDIYLAILDGTGEVTHAVTFAGNGDESLRMATRVGAGALVIAGESFGGLNLGGGPLKAGLYLAKFSDVLVHVWSASWPDCEVSPNAFDAVAPGLDDSSDNVYLSAHCTSATNFGGGSLPVGRVLVAFDGTGKHIWSRSIPDAAVIKQLVALEGAVYLVGSFNTPFDLGLGLVSPSPPGMQSTFVAKISK